MGKTYGITRSQQLPCDIHTAWAFFSIPSNLSKITPPDMKFMAKSAIADQPVFEGMVLDFHVSPLFSIRMRWRSQIAQVDGPYSFTDVQTKGPFKRWQHRHEYIANAEGVLVLDTVDYQLPFGLLGRLAHGLVRKNLEKLFDYRIQTLERILGQRISG